MAEITERLVADYEQQIDDLTNRVNNLAADLLETRAQLHESRGDVSRLRVALEAAEDDRDEARHALRECAAELKRAEQALHENPGGEL